MRLENVLALTNAKLKNDTFVSKFRNFTTSSKNTKRGDLFIAYEEKEIDEAILNGAYGVIYDCQIESKDDEIAFIQVENVDIAFSKLLRFIMIEKNIIAYECDEVFLQFTKQISCGDGLFILYENIKNSYIDLLNIKKNSIILFCPTLHNKDIFSNIKKPTGARNIEIRKKTIFTTSFVYENNIYNNKQIAPLFTNTLGSILNFLNNKNIEFNLDNLEFIKNFEASFVDNFLELKDFGSTNKVMIFEQNEIMFNLESDYLKSDASWAKLVFLIPQSNLKYQICNNTYRYKKRQDIKKILKNKNFNFALILGANKKILQEKENKQEQLTLF